MRLIGDIHGDLNFYKSAIKGQARSIQLGDFGVGFVPTGSLLELEEEEPFHRFIRGNHDNPEFCLELNRNIRSGTFQEDCFYLGGAWSIDRDYRTPGLNWWSTEQHTQAELDYYLELYVEAKPHTVISHDCPTLVAYNFFLKNNETFLRLTRTGETLQRMFESHQPQRWFFGHWHNTKSGVIEGCEFNCLGINTIKDVEW